MGANNVDLVGRGYECKMLDDLLAAVRRGLSQVLVLRGEAGVGKTALIDYAIGAADDFLVVRFTGAESEMDLGFAALHRLLLPILHQIERLPGPQRDALNTALGLATGPPANPFLVGLGVISLAANGARARERLLCVIDDAQWVDRESLAALAFWGRRIHAERIALIFGERDRSDTARLLDGFPVLDVGGLANDAARVLLSAAAGVGLDREVADRIVTETEGNPLALIQLAKDLTPDQLIGAAAGLQPLPLSRRLEERFARQVRSLPVDTQMLLLVAAADSTADAAFVWTAASLLGVAPEAAEAAETAGLVVLGSAVGFRHPLIRSAVYAGARPADRRAAHRALAAATDAAGEAERRAWHLAAAAIGRDEEIAGLLERCAERAGARGGHTAELALLNRSAEMTPDPHRAAERQVDAAAAALEAGAPVQVHALVTLATPALRDPMSRAKAQRLDGCAWTREEKVAVAAPILLSAAVEQLPIDPRLGRQTLLEALYAAFLCGRLANDDITRAIAESARAAPPGDGTIVDLLLDAFATYVTDGYVAAVPRLRSAVRAISRAAPPAEELVLRWARLAIYATQALWDVEAHDQLVARLVRATRERGTLSWLAIVLQARGTSEMWAGQFGRASISFAEAVDLRAAAGENPWSGAVADLHLVAVGGRDTEVRAKAGVVIPLAGELGCDSTALVAHHALVVLNLGQRRYGEALEHALAVFDHDPINTGHLALPDMVEAAVRAGDGSSANLAMDRLAERAPASGTAWAMGLLARSRALLAGDDAEPSYKDSIELLVSTPMAVELARTHLLYGEWLRRQKRRIDARDQLRMAYDMFATMGAEAFAKRAADELLATGERARRRSVETTTDLTPQEAHVARLAAGGDTNAEIAAMLFISASTVEYHLRKVFRKLAISSRRQLKRALADE